ncbi:putative DNA-binding domain-containing protein [Roseovarius sp.]|uniref:HvfC/BufC family peptide modification chaperone n=1 Tax=Roseovarius sp. TaxID=1486281 RepID=UPI003BA841B0
MARTLAELQDALQNDVLNRQSTSLDSLSVPEGTTAESRLAVYQNAYETRLLNILSEDYDTLWSFMGDTAFRDLAQSYLRAHPSTSRNARWVGHALPDYLAAQPIAAQIPALPEIARLERAIRDAFDAPDAPVATPEDLATIADHPEQTVFTLHPSLTLLPMRTNAYDIFRALRAGTTPPPPASGQDLRWIVAWRRDLNSHHAELTDGEGPLLDLARQGHSFAHLCEAAAMLGAPDTTAARMAAHLRGWLENGMISAMGRATARDPA